MKIFFLLTVGFELILYSSFSIAQKKDSVVSSNWKFNMELDFYLADPFLILPIFQADKNKLHLEARYNYEDLKTFSAWAGYHFSGGKNFQYDILPMAGGLTGRINGLAAGFKLNFSFWDFGFYTESEYVFDINDKENNFYYDWTDLTYSPVEWFFFGLSAQKTKAYETELDFQRGIFAGGSFKNLEMSVYFYNPGHEDKFFLLTVSTEF